MNLLELGLGVEAWVEGVEQSSAGDPVARRLRELGFVRGEPVRTVALGPFGGDPLVVAIGGTRFALRRAEAARVHVTRDVADGTSP